MYRYDDILVLPEDLMAFAWSAPMRDLASHIGMSDVGLKKLILARGFVTPPQGYWNKVHAGKPVPRPPAVPPRRPGQYGRVRLDRRFAKVLPVAEPMDSSGPFASREVPEDLDVLYEKELRAIGRMAVPRTEDRLHQALSHILRKEDRRREKAAADRWAWDLPLYDNPLDRRRMRIMSAIFSALSKRGHAGEAYEQDGGIRTVATIGDTRVGFEVTVSGNHKTIMRYGRMVAAPDLPMKTPLAIRIDSHRSSNGIFEWRDGKEQTVEKCIAEIAARLIVAGEERFRTGLRESEEFREQQRLREEARRREELEARNRERLRLLHESGRLLQEADEIRSLVNRVRAAVIAGETSVSTAALDLWEEWALAEADRTDPIKSGQVMSHLIADGD